MGNIGGGEILLVLLVALVILGPQRLPGAMREVGKVAGELRRMSQGFKSELDAAARLSDGDDEIERRAREKGRATITGTSSLGITKPPRANPAVSLEEPATSDESATAPPGDSDATAADEQSAESTVDDESVRRAGDEESTDTTTADEVGDGVQPDVERELTD